MRARMSRRGAPPTTSGGSHERDRSGGAGTDRVGRPQASEPPGDGQASPAEVALRRRARHLERAEEIARRLSRRIQAYRRAWAERRINSPAAEWANERDIDFRIAQADPVAVSDSFRDAADVLEEIAAAWEREIGLD